MMNKMRTNRSRHRTGSDPEVSVKREKGKLEKKQSATRFIPANGQSGSPIGKKLVDNSNASASTTKKKRHDASTPSIRRETVSRTKASGTPKQTGSNTKPPITTRQSPSNTSIKRTPSKLGLRRSPSKLFQKKNTPKSVNSKSPQRVLPPLTPSQPSQPVSTRRAPSKISPQHQNGSKRFTVSDGSVGSKHSFKKSLGIRPRHVPRKIAPRVSDDWTFFTFNTLPESQARRVLEQQRRETERAEAPGCLTTCFGNMQTTCSAIGHSLVEGCGAIGTNTSLCFLGACGALAGGVIAICNTLSLKRDSPDVETVTTMDDYIARTKEKDQAYAQMFDGESREPSSSSVYRHSHDDENVRVSPRSVMHPPPIVMQESRVSKYCVEATMEPSIYKVAPQEDEQVAASSRASDSKPPSHYAWENLDDESLVERSVVPHTPPNKVMIGRKLIDYDDLTTAYNQAEQSQSELDDPGCECFEGCFQWDEEEFLENGDERTLETYLEPSYADHPKQRYNLRENPSTVMEGDEMTQPSAGATSDGTYDSRDEQSLETESQATWRY